MREITLPDRTKVIVNYIIKFLEKYGEFDKTIIFCASQYHAAQVAELLNNNPKHKTDRYAVRITREERSLISTIFSGVQQRMRDPHNLKKVIAMIDEIDFSSPEDTHALSIVYEELLMMGREGGAAGEYYTPRPIVKFMVRIIKPDIGQKIFDPFVGSAGFLVESYKFIIENRKIGTQEYEILQDSFYGQELKAIPYLIGIMNCLLHGIRRLHIRRVDTFEENVRSPGERYIHESSFRWKGSRTL